MVLVDSYILYFRLFFSDMGGELTLYMTGNAHKLSMGRPSREPLYSKGDRDQYPIPEEYSKVRYVDFVSSHVKNSDNMLISQSIHESKFCGIFGTHKRYKTKSTSTSWGKKSSYPDMIEYIRTQWKDDKYVFSLVADEETGSFYVYLVEGFGYDQSIVKELSDIKEKWDDGKMITSCTSNRSTYYIVMTDKVSGYHDAGQSYFTRKSWSDVSSEIGKHYKDGKIITSLCYNQRLKEYLVIMTASSEGQSYKRTSNSKERSKWIDEMYKKDRHPTIVFKDPNDDQILVVMTSDDQRSGYTTRYNYQLE